MYKALSNIKFMGKLYVKDEAINLPKKLGKELEAEGVVEVLKENGAEKKKREDAEKKRKADEKKDEEDAKKDAKKEYADMSDDELINTLKTREIDHKDLSREESIELLERSDRVMNN